MRYVIDFDIVAILVMGLALFHYFTRKKIANDQNFRFQIVVWVALGSSIFSLASSLAINELPSFPSAPIIALTTVFYLFHVSIAPLVAYYVLALGAQSRYFPPPAKILFALPWIASLGIVVSNPFTGFAFFVDSTSLFTHGQGLFTLYALAGVYYAAIVYVVIFRCKELASLHRLAFLSALVFPLLAGLIQNLVSGLSLECFSVACSLFLILLTIQNNTEMIDAPTGLYNRGAFIGFFRQAISRKRDFAILVAHSSVISDLQGIVDARTYVEVLSSFAKWLSRAAGKRLSTCYLDSGLFAVIYDKENRDDPVGDLALKIIERSKGPWRFDQIQMELPCRVAVLQCPKDAPGVPELLDYIDQLTGLSVQVSDRHLFYSSDFISNKYRREAAIAIALEKAIRANQVELRYQPIYSIRQSRPVALEALACLGLENGEYIYQSEILSTAERMGLARRLSGQILDLAFERYVANGLAEKGIERLELRLVSAMCVELDWPRAILSLADQHGMSLSRLRLALTETTVANASKDMQVNMDLLAGQGVAFALDDFGSGYTDLGKIISLPFSIVKLDKKIVKSGFDTIKGGQLMEGSITLFKHMGRGVVAEGVERDEEAEALALMGCDYLQGYFFGRPMASSAILSWLDSFHKA